MATILFIALGLLFLATAITGSTKKLLLILLSCCLIIVGLNPSFIFMLPPKKSTDEKLFATRINSKKNTFNKQYVDSMCKDKRFGSNQEKYLRLKAFAI